MNYIRYPFVKQEDLKDCGVACLQMIIRYYKGYVSMAELRDLTNTKSDGVSAYNLVMAAKKLGFEAKGVRCDDLNHELTYPLIAHVTIENKLNHYIVVYNYDVKEEILTIADPASKIKKISLTSFMEIWNHILILLVPVKTIPLKHEYVVKDFLKQLLKEEKINFSYFFLFSFFLTGFFLAFSFSFQYMLEGVNKVYAISYFTLCLIIFSAIAILKNITNYFRSLLISFINQNVSLTLMNHVLEKIIYLPYSHYRNFQSGELIAKVNNLKLVEEVINSILIFVFNLIVAILSFIILFFLNSSLALIFLFFQIVYILIFLVNHFLIKEQVLLLQNSDAHFLSTLLENINNFETIRGLNIEEKYFLKLKDSYSDHNAKEHHFIKQNFFFMLIKDILFDLFYLIIIFLGSYYIYDGKLALGLFLTFLAVMDYVMVPFKDINIFLLKYEDALIALKRVLELPVLKENGLIKNKLKGEISFNHLNYLDYDKVILNGLSFKIKPAEKVLILGPSGSGKSTLFKLLTRNLATRKSEIFLDNIDINDYDIKSIKEGIAYLSQNEHVFAGTLFDNLRLKRNIDDKNILEMINICEIDKIASKNVLGYKMVIAEDAFNLSGGEKQRIILARTLLSKFQILLIDEGTNQMDDNLERRILKKVFNKFKDKTIIIISHRSINQDLFDRVLILEKGKLKDSYARC